MNSKEKFVFVLACISGLLNIGFFLYEGVLFGFTVPILLLAPAVLVLIRASRKRMMGDFFIFMATLSFIVNIFLLSELRVLVHDNHGGTGAFVSFVLLLYMTSFVFIGSLIALWGNSQMNSSKTGPPQIPNNYSSRKQN